MVLEVTVKGKSGEKIFQTQRIYMPQCTDSLSPKMVLGPTKKLGIIRDTTFQPFKPKREEFLVGIGNGAGKVIIGVKLVYRLRPGDEMLIHDWSKTASTQGLF